MSSHNTNSFSNKSTSTHEEQETDNSFVRKVKSRVSGLIPSSLTKWFRSEDNQRAVVRPREDDDEEQIQPPFKRVKLPNEVHTNNYTVPRQEPLGLSSRQGIRITPGELSRSLFVHDNIPGTSTGARGFYNDDDKDSESGESTSGYSSLAKITAPSEEKTEAYDVMNVINANQFSSSSFGNDRTLFMDRSTSSNPNTSLSSRRPSFNASTFGSPNFVDRTLSTQQIMRSPFYNGYTMYGGAAANTKPKPPKTHVKPVNETSQKINHNATLSKTARRILDTLEQYATDVNRMPHPLADKKPIAARYSGAHPYIIRELRPSNTELQVPTVSDLLKMKLKERLQDSTVAVRHIASTSKSAQDEYKTSKHTNKIKSKISSVRQKNDDEVAPTTNLPEISLPITTLPKFDLSFPLLSSNPSKQVTVVCNELPKTKPPDISKLPKSPTKSKAAPPPKISELSVPVTTLDTKLTPPQELSEFKFADPLVLAENLKSIIAINDFKFSEPLIFSKLTADGFNLKFKNNPKLVENSSSDLVKFKPAADTWECSTCLLRNLPDKIKCVACEAPKRTEEIKTKTPFGSEFKLTSDKWECTYCMVRNLNKDSVCVACTTPKVKLNGPLATLFKPPSNTWECLTCMIRNKDEFKMCEACETPKVGSATQPPKSLDIFKMKSDKWECSTCMVHNSLDKTICVACETPKANTTTKLEAKTAPSFIFGVFQSSKTATTGFTPTNSKNSLMDSKTSPTFNFGFKNDTSDALNKTAQLIVNNKDKNVVEGTSNFTFGLKVQSGDSEPVKSPEPVQVPEQQPKDVKVSFAPSITSSTSNKYFVSNSTAFSPSKTPKAVTAILPGFNSNFVPSTLIISDSVAPFRFGATTTAPIKSIDTPSKPLFQPTTSLSSTPVLEAQPVSKTVFEMPVKPLDGPAVTASPSKPVFEEAKPAFETPVSAPVFNSGFNTTPAFSFVPAEKSGGFSFGPKPPAESEKAAPLFNFGATSGGFSFTPSTAMPGFSFNAPKTEQSLFTTNVQPVKNIFGGESALPTQPSAPLQNGVFNFGGPPATTGFSFGASTQTFSVPAANPAPGLFNFGASQPTSTTTDGFNFGTTTTPNFDASIKPTFNFTGGTTPTFSAQTTSENPAVAQRRKIRAVRRNPQR